MDPTRIFTTQNADLERAPWIAVSEPIDSHRRVAGFRFLQYSNTGKCRYLPCGSATWHANSKHDHDLGAESCPGVLTPVLRVTLMLISLAVDAENCSVWLDVTLEFENWYNWDFVKGMAIKLKVILALG